MGQKLFYYISLMRPANIVTAITDIIAGAAIGGALFMGSMHGENLAFLILSTIGLYGGGIVFNDVFDIEIDRKERPERILPSGKLSLKTAHVFGTTLLLMGVVAAFLVSPTSGSIAIGIALLALSYDRFTKHIQWLGPLNMGLCRAGNLLLGVSILPDMVGQYWWLGIVPILFISAVTLTSQKEAVGDNKRSISLALGLDCSILITLLLLSNYTNFNLTIAAAFIVIWFSMNALAKYRAINNNTPDNIKRAVKMGVLSLIPLDAAFAAGFSGILWLGFLLLLLFPLSIALAKRFAVT